MALRLLRPSRCNTIYCAFAVWRSASAHLSALPDLQEDDSAITIHSYVRTVTDRPYDVLRFLEDLGH